MLRTLCWSIVAAAAACAGSSPEPAPAGPPQASVPIPEAPASDTPDTAGKFDAGEPQAEVRASGLRIVELEVGRGELAEPGQRVVIHYVGRLVDDSVFDSSRERGTPFEFGLGKGHVIKGFEEGVAGMRVGGKRRLIIPPELGYGESGSGAKIPPNSVLIFEVELLDVQL
jgi:FKBP-type peptidyl-prolyl cis-trans isomerase